MASKRQRGKRGKRSPKRPASAAPATPVEVEPGRLAAWTDALAAGTAPEELPPTTDAEFEAWVRHLAASERLTLLAALRPVATSGPRRRALRRVEHALAQRGLVVPGAQARRGGKWAVTTDPAPGHRLPVLMAPPGPDAARIFTFAHRRVGASVTLVELYFSVPEGLYRLKSSPSDPSTYTRWAKDMARGHGGGLPGRLEVPPALLRRKLWEAARAIREGHIGGEVDPALAATLRRGGSPPPHPAHGLDLSRGRVLDVPNLAQRPHRLAPLEHAQALPVLERDWRQHGGDVAIVSGSRRDSRLGQAVTDWATQWGFEAITELLLDATVWHAAHRDWDAARTFYEVVGPPREPGSPGDGGARDRARRQRVIELLLGFVLEHFSRRRVGLLP